MEEKIKNFQNSVDTPITLQEVTERLSSIRCRKASGLDGILPEMLKYSAPEIQAAMVKLFNIVLSAGYFPRTWNQGLITPIHKSGDRYDPANYRGICVSSNLGKLFNSILNKRILTFLTEHNVLSKSQAGFMPNHRTTDHIYTLHSLIQRHVYNTKNGKIYACFVDFKKAFDSVWHPGLFLKLLESGIGGKTYDVIKSSYTENSCSVSVSGKRTAFFQQSRGVRQGCSLSPTLFNIYINELATALESSSAPGLTLHDAQVKFLLYADDLLLLSPTEKGLQDNLKILEKFSSTWALPVNLKKTNTMVFQRRKRRSDQHPSFILNNCDLTGTDKYTYLGLEIHRSGSFKQAIETLKDKACKTFYAIRRTLYHLKPPVRVWLKIFDSIIAPILLCGSEVWGPHTYPDWSKWDSSPTEIFHLEFCKHLLQVHRSTSNSACRAELGRFPLHLTVLKRALSFRAQLHRSNPSSHHHKALIHEGETEKPEPPEQPSQTQPEQNTNHTNHNNLTKAGIRKMADEGQERYVSDWKNDIISSQKLIMYRSLQRDYRLAPYLEKLPDPRDRQILSRYKLSAHSLAIECGRHRQSYKPREERLCQHCDQEAIEDETHFLLHCSKYSANPDWHGFSDDPEEDVRNMRLVFFFGVSVSLVLVPIFIHYSPERGMKDWVRREAERQIKRKEALGLPLIEMNYYDPKSLVFPPRR
ncbi:unnamed protein product [Ranitomeya imitator]|uniref:NADH dehydrogenase [ubiquinone] 1 beta subcomplex subunit 11, mitochondrial n=1 Tax=Ranitomeya imitator TaxID=111125 RepID=A0ABN9KXH9_9NEOB|nr:unnamed protein product [Ranitomeya imitator]